MPSFRPVPCLALRAINTRGRLVGSVVNDIDDKK
jgi:hypothetical protein